MATPELAARRLPGSRAASAAAPSSSAEKRGPRGKVIEFDPGTSKPPEPEPAVAPAGPERSRGFVYDGVRAGRAVRAGLSRRSAASRPLPMEEVCLYVKPMENSTLRRQPDPESKKDWARVILIGIVALITVVASHAPRALLRQSGYRLEKLQQRHQALLEINEQLKVRQAMMTDLHRVTELAARRGLTATPPERFAWQDRTIGPSDSGELARNSRP